MAASKLLSDYVTLVQSYSGRDKVIRIIQYASFMCSGLTRSNVRSEKLVTITLQLGLCRTILRLFDDLPMLAYTLSYGLGRREQTTFMQALGVLKNVVDQAFFPMEHIAWAADNKLINVSSKNWWTLSIAAWMASLSLGMVKNGGHVLELQARRKQAFKEAKSLQDGNIQLARDLTTQQLGLLLTMLADGCDFCNAVHWMPEGFLWANQLTNKWVGLLGTISSLVKLIQLIQQKR